MTKAEILRELANHTGTISLPGARTMGKQPLSWFMLRMDPSFLHQ